MKKTKTLEPKYSGDQGLVNKGFNDGGGQIIREDMIINKEREDD